MNLKSFGRGVSQTHAADELLRKRSYFPVSTLQFDQQSVKSASRNAAEPPVSKPGNFAQAAVAVLERISLLLLRHIHDVTIEECLILALSDVRRALALRDEQNELLTLRDWPEDLVASGALQTLVTRLSELEPTSWTEDSTKEPS